MAVDTTIEGLTLLTDADVFDHNYGEVDFQEVGSLARIAFRGRSRSATRFDEFKVSFHCDDEVIRDYWTIERREFWEFRAVYNSWNTSPERNTLADYGRVQSRSLDRTSAYRSRISQRSRGDPRNREFFLSAVLFKGDLAEIRAELASLAEFSSRTELSAQSIDLWIANRFDVRVWCKDCSLFGDLASILPARVLDRYAGKQDGLEEFQRALRCKHCGKKNAGIEPFEQQVRVGDFTPHEVSIAKNDRC